MKLTRKYSVGGTRVDIMTMNLDSTFDSLPVGIYSVRKDIFGFYLEIIKQKFEVPTKLYGNAYRRADKVINTYDTRTVSTGVMLTGDKGSGKTILSELICNKMLDKNIPVVMVTECHSGEAFNNFINSLGEIVLFFDEFGKVYKNNKDMDEDSQSSLLTLFDGSHSLKRLLIVTENSERDIDEFMKNRPGRLYYHFRYKKLTSDVITEFIMDNVVDNNKEIAVEINKIANALDEFSFDVLKAIVEEYNRYGGEIIEIIDELNIDRGYVSQAKMRIISIFDKNGTEVEKDTSRDIYSDVSENGGNDYVYYKEKYVRDGETHYSDESLYIYKRDLKLKKDNKMIFETDCGFTVVAEKVEDVYNFSKYNHLF